MALLPPLFLLLLLDSVPSPPQALPLASLTIEGSALSRPVILDLADLRSVTAIDDGGIEQACKKLQATGLFSSVTSHYTTDPASGTALVLTLADQSALIEAVIDVPGLDENEPWQWLSTRFPRFNHRVPQAETAQKFLASEIEQHLGGSLRGQHLAAAMQWDSVTTRTTLVFQLETRPKLLSLAFAGNHAIATGVINSLLRPALKDMDYSNWKIAAALRANILPLYEERGYYRVHFAPSATEWTDAGVTQTIAIDEGPRYRLGNLTLAAGNLPSGVTAAARFPEGKIADGKQIQPALRDLERALRRTGYLAATVAAERIFDDEAHVMNLRVHVESGPIYRFGALDVTGLGADLAARAKEQWQLKPGDPYDAEYANEFLQGFVRAAGARSFTKWRAEARKGKGENVVDVRLIFEPR